MLEVRIVHLYADVLASCQQRCCARTSASCKWIEYALSWQSEAADQRHQRRYRLLRGMEFVAAIRISITSPSGMLRQRRSAFGQQKCLLMLIAEEPALRAIALAKNDVSDGLKTCIAPCFEERIDLGLSVEHDGDAILLEYAVRLGHRRFKPALVDVVLNRASTSVAIVAMKDLVGEVVLLCGCYVRGCHL
jgi:hypothetical protein